MSVGSGGTQRQDQQFSPAQEQMQRLINEYSYNAYHREGRPDFQAGTDLYAPSGGERDVMSQWQKSLQGAQNWSPYNSSNNPYSGQGNSSGQFTGITDTRSPWGGGEGNGSTSFTGGNPNITGFSGRTGQGSGGEGSGSTSFTGGDPNITGLDGRTGQGSGGEGSGSSAFTGGNPNIMGLDGRTGQGSGGDGTGAANFGGEAPRGFTDSTYGGNNANTGESTSNNPAEEWYKRMQGAIRAGSQMPGLQGPDIQRMGALQGPDIQGPGTMQGPDIREMGALNQAPTAEAAIAAAQKNLSTITAPGLAQQAAATGGSMDSGAYLEALANAGTAASVPISQQQLAMQGQYGLQGNELMSQQNQQANAIRGQYGLQSNDINAQYGLQGNDIRSQYGLQSNDIANQQNQQGNQIRAGYGLQANDLAGSLAQGRQNQLYGMEMAAPGMGAALSANNLAFENERNQGLLGLAGTEREGQLQDYLRQQNYLQGAMGLLPTGAFSNPATNSRMQSSPGLMESLLGFTQAGKNIGQGMGASMGKGGSGSGGSSLGALMALA